MSNKEVGLTKSAIGFFVGLAAGALLSLLFVTKSGKEAQEELKSRGERPAPKDKEDLAKTCEELTATAKEKTKKVKEGTKKSKASQVEKRGEKLKATPKKESKAGDGGALS